MKLLSDDHVRGPADAPVTLIEYGDFQCPYCRAAHEWLPGLLDDNRIRFAYRHFPITSTHPIAELAAEAAEASGDRFWDMHDWLFEQQPRLGAEMLVEGAVRIGLDTKAFADALESHTHRDRVQRDFLTGLRSGVNGTPTFFVNGERYDGPHTADAMSAYLASLSEPAITRGG